MPEKGGGSKGERGGSKGEHHGGRPMPVRGGGGGRVLGSFKRGGTVERTGNYRLHEGERVVPAKRGNKRKKKRNRSRE